MQEPGVLNSPHANFNIDSSRVSAEKFKGNPSLISRTLDNSAQVIQRSSIMVGGHRASELKPLLNPNLEELKAPIAKANNQFTQWRADKETAKSLALAEKKPSLSLKERLTNACMVLKGIKDNYIPTIGGTKSKLDGAYTQACRVATAIKNTTREEVKEKLKSGLGDVAVKLKSQTISTGRTIISTPGKIFSKGKSLGERAIDRIGERGKDRNLILFVRLGQWTAKGIHTVANVAIIAAPLMSSGLTVISTAASGAGAAIGFLLAGIISYSTLKKLWKMDSPIELIREKAPKVITKILPERIKVGYLEKYVKGNSLSKERITQYAVTKRELARLTKLKNEGNISADDMQKYYMLRVVDRKLFYRRLNAGITLMQASIIVAASSLSIAGLCSGPAGPILLGIGIGVGVGGMIGCMSLRLGVFTFRRIRRNFINDVEDAAKGKKYITSDEMRRYTFEKLKAEMQAEEESGPSSLNHIMDEKYKSKKLTMNDVKDWNSSELAIFLMMRGNRDKTQFTIRNSKGDFKPRIRKLTPEGFRNSLFEKDGSKANFNGAWKKAFGG